ncbi:MAG: hypothetical protein K0Q59_3714 [Paenibacillus sp.]|nr:hypothetical protein [Paenibacillus sp.]
MIKKLALSGGRAVGATLVLTLGVLMVASCSGSKSEEKKESAPTAPAKDWTKEKVELTFYYMHSDDIEKTFNESIAPRITKKYPNFTLKYMRNFKGTTLAEVTAAKTNIDFFAGLGATLVTAKDYGYLGDVTDLVKTYKIDLDKFEPTSINIMKTITGGGIPGFPQKINSTALYYNKDLFDKFGVPYLTDNMTWDNVLDTARKLTRVDGGAQYYGLGLHVGNLMLVGDTAPKLLDATNHAALNNDYWKKMFDRLLPLASISNDAKARNDLANYTNSFKMFHTDRTVAIQVANNTVHTLISANAPTMKWDIAQFPTFPDMPKAGPQPAPYYYYVSKTSPNREAAFLAIAELVNDANQLDAATKGNVPSFKDRSLLNSLGTAEPSLQGKNVKAYVPKTYSEITVLDPYASQANSALVAAFYDVVAGKKDAVTSLRDAQEAANKKIDELLKK